MQCIHGDARQTNDFSLQIFSIDSDVSNDGMNFVEVSGNKRADARQE